MKYKTDIKKVKGQLRDLITSLEELREDEVRKTDIILIPGTATEQAYRESIGTTCELFLERLRYLDRIMIKWIAGVPGKRKPLPPPRPEKPKRTRKKKDEKQTT